MRLPWRRGERASSLDLLVVGLGNPGSRVRAHAAQRRLDGRRGARAKARRFLARKVQRQARRATPRRPPGRAAQAGDVHERVGSLGRGRGEVLQGRAGCRARRARRGRLRPGTAPGAPGRRPRRTQRAALDRAASRHAGVSPPPHRRRPARARRPALARGLRPVRTSSRTTTPRRSSPGPPMRSRRSTPRASTGRRPGSTKLAGARRPPRHASWSETSNSARFSSRSSASCSSRERLQEFAAALPTSARVSEPALPLVVAALHEQLGRSLTILVPEDADARDLAEAAAWFLGQEHTGVVA